MVTSQDAIYLVKAPSSGSRLDELNPELSCSGKCTLYSWLWISLLPFPGGNTVQYLKGAFA